MAGFTQRMSLEEQGASGIVVALCNAAVFTSQCPVTCGKGMKQRQVWCQQSEDPVRDGFCNTSTKPESLRPCELRACASWHVGPWGSVSI